MFFTSPDPKRLYEWYSRWLGLDVDHGPGISFPPQSMPANGLTVWSAFDSTTTYLAPSTREFMFNLVVDDLDGALRQAAEGGASIVGDVEQYDYGRFGWFMDPDGNKVELWEPPRL